MVFLVFIVSMISLNGFFDHDDGVELILSEGLVWGGGRRGGGFRFGGFGNGEGRGGFDGILNLFFKRSLFFFENITGTSEIIE